MTPDPVARARALRNIEDAAALYATWADSYDADVFGEGRFVGSRRIADLLLAALAGRDVAVLDIGCGTGEVGGHLARSGLTVIDGIDLSPEMLAVAAGKSIYRGLFAADLHGRLPDGLGTYSAMVSAGTFTGGHVGAVAIPALLDLLEPGGLIAWVIGGAVWPDFEPEIVAAELEVIHQRLEPVRLGGDPESVMLVARRP